MNRDKQIEFERYEISEIIAQNFKYNEDKYDASDFEWAAHCVQMAGYRKASDVAREIFGMLREDLKGEVDMEYFERLLTIYEKKYTENGK